MDEIEQVAQTVLNLNVEALEELIEFLQTDGAIESMSDSDIRNIALMREAWQVGDKYYFSRPKTSGKSVGIVLTSAKNSIVGREKVLEILIDTKQSLGKMND